MSSNNTKILYVASEAAPFMTTGGLGEVAGSLPKALMQKYDDTLDIRVILPLYESITEDMRANFEFVGSTFVSLSWRRQYCGIFKTCVDNVTYYFIDNEYYFKRRECYGHFDDGERFAFFSKAVLFILPTIDFIPDIIHVNDWQTSLIPIYLKTKYKNYSGYRDIKTIITIHNIEYQGMYDLSIAEDVFDLHSEEKSIIEYNGSINLLKGALELSDIISTVSQSYAHEIFSDYFAHGLASIIQKNFSKVKGILNGIDTSIYDPETDKSLFKNYSMSSLKNKYKNKTALQGMSGLPQNKDIPVIAIISRLVAHKGMDLIVQSIDEILKERVQIMILGKGDRGYELYFKSLEEKYHDKLSVRIDYNNDISRKMYAGADIFLMPSLSEPCGIAQMIASRYGTIPVVTETGGLKDSIKDCGLGSGNGFTFYGSTAADLVLCVNRALDLYKNQKNWINLVSTAMSTDFSWSSSAVQYYDMYLDLKNN